MEFKKSLIKKYFYNVMRKVTDNMRKEQNGDWLFYLRSRGNSLEYINRANRSVPTSSMICPL